ncbi:hypothetical protein E9993_01405 [Labilibacter sediminis]|nr:hypothetical protein E9993_01405 [Labilibacter sediminis]
MKSIVFLSLVILSVTLNTCNSEEKEIIGNWFDNESHTWYHFFKNGTYNCFVYEPVSTKGKIAVLRHGSIGYYKYTGPREFNLYEVDVDLSPILGKSITDAAIAIYVDNFMKSHTKPDLDSAKPSFLAQIQSDGEHLYILHNNDIIIKLRLRHTKFGDKT